MKNTIRCPEPGCEREVSATLLSEVNASAVLMRTYLASCPDHGEFRQPELIERAVAIPILNR